MLILPIKKKWFDMIKSGEKKEEYREIKPYWFTRFKNNLIIYEYDWLGDCIEISKGRGTVIFKNGYQKNAPKIKCAIEITTGYGKKEWGAKLSELYYVLKILSVEEVISLKDEIKEMCHKCKKYPAEYNQTYCEFCLGISDKDDYITNLQEELKEYKMIFDAFSERPYAHRYLEEKKKELGNSKIIGLDSEIIYKDYYDLKEENERLKELNVCVGCNNNPDYKSRNEKAIRYIEERKNLNWYADGVFVYDLLNILNGGDEE